MPDAPTMNELLGADTPKNWGKWGPDDELGCAELPRREGGAAGRRSTSARATCSRSRSAWAAPTAPATRCGRAARAMAKKMALDESTWDGDGAPQFPGGLHYADDTAQIFLQGSTQYDALGHVWYDGQLWNGYDARTTVGAMDKASVLPIAEKGVVGRGVLIDMARHRGKDWLDKGETFDHNDLEAAAAAQGVTIEPHDILCVRTGCMKYWYELNDKEKFYDGFNEPGLTYSRELVEWFQQREVPNLVTDTIANEVTYEPESGVALPLHCALMRNLGVDAHRDRLARRPRRRLRGGRPVELPLRRGPAQGRRGHGRAGQPDRDPLMGVYDERAVAAPLRRRAATRHHAGVPRRADHVRRERGTQPRRGRHPLLRRAHHLPRARRAHRRVRGRAARRRPAARRPGGDVPAERAPVHHRAGRHVEGGRHRGVDQPDEPRAGARRCC